MFDSAPRRVYWEVTRVCDLACRHCRAEAAPEPDPAELSPREGLDLIARLGAFGVPLPHLILTGGDPLARRDLFELIAAARERGFAVSVAPSATPRLTAEAIAALAEAGVAATSLSLDGSDAARHDTLRGVPGCFERDSAVFRGLRLPELLGGRCGRCEWREACGGSRARAFAASGNPLGEDPLCSYESIAAAPAA